MAPGYLVRVTKPNNGYSFEGNGTSFAAPLVSGTAGLMLSANNCLSPYQLEYGLKTTAVNIYNIPENQKYRGKLGAGWLDAGAAVSWAANHDCNSLFTTTMHVKGIELNTICRPGQSSNGINPVLKPQIENGTPPYTYEWKPLAGNEAVLSATDVANPEVISSRGRHQLKYYLTVYDNSPVQKVASKQIEIQLSSNNTYDLAMQDSYMDMMNEPNNQIALDSREWDVWQSPDIWNRKEDDGEKVHENPEYFVSNPNYIYTRIRNIGCAASPSSGMKLHLYWTKASTGENWDADWTTATVIGSGGSTVEAGAEITTTPIGIPSIPSGGEYIVSHKWFPIKPEAYDPLLNTTDVCFLARITESGTRPFGMTTPEVMRIKDNVLNNNNIITRNFIVTNFNPGNLKRLHQVYVGNADSTVAQNFDLDLVNEKDINPHFAGDISEAGTVILHLGEVYDRWVKNGAKGTYGKVDRKNRTVTYNGSEAVVLENISFKEGERMPIFLEFLANSKYRSETPFKVHLRQFERKVKRSGVPYGSVSFNIEPTLPKSSSKDKNIVNRYTLYPNPATDKLKIHYIGTRPNNQITTNVYDLKGKLIFKQKDKISGTAATIDVDVSKLAKGVYFLKLIDQDKQSEKIKFVKK